MTDKTDKKILPLHDLIEKLEKLRRSGRAVVQSHGIFDIIHPGIIAHLKSAKKMGDVLAVTVIKDKDVRRGPRRPIFPAELRAQSVASLSYVDYVCIVDDGIPFECVKSIKPDVFAKGQTYKERAREVHSKIFEEERELYFGKAVILETEGLNLSSANILNGFLETYPRDTRVFLRKLAKKHSFNSIQEQIDSLHDLNVLLIGDGVIDEYHYVDPMNKSPKAHLIVNRFLEYECFSGGVFAIAGHLANFCSSVQLVTLLGREDSREEFITNSLKPNIKAKFFYREDGPTIVKKRYINQYLNQKLFEVNYLKDTYIEGPLESEIIDYLKSHIPAYDLVLISDYGHGFISNKIIREVEKTAGIMGINAQTNGANAGYNLVTKYRKPYYVCLDEPELRLAAQERFADIREVAGQIARVINSKYLIATLGKKGSIGISKKGEINSTPVFSSMVVDTVGAGDAFFAVTAPCLARSMPLDLVSFIGNAVGAIAVQIVGNKRSIEKSELLYFIETLLK